MFNHHPLWSEGWTEAQATWRKLTDAAGDGGLDKAHLFFWMETDGGQQAHTVTVMNYQHPAKSDGFYTDSSSGDSRQCPYHTQFFGWTRYDPVLDCSSSFIDLSPLPINSHRNRGLLSSIFRGVFWRALLISDPSFLRSPKPTSNRSAATQISYPVCHRSSAISDLTITVIVYCETAGLENSATLLLLGPA
ncbi:hypothetical protein PGTUg99_014888 [Puccinia graminis f. sp. tritici]|uniref:Uncharacterized protein n=1 Tax=Puccinia graminis f. sp. tritici TaxID=56615 RepID=A0A5B0R7S0_PUCGR|nr:hypothetical protein PGTUg99_014888 [Puccinia graminis f. sp. tritici]